jgi:osmotically-inducible protein OsmY
MKNDTQIQRDVVAQLDQKILAGTLGVEVHHGVVKLAGRVGDDAIKKSAELAAGGVDDVTRVIMDVDVGAAPAAGGNGARAAVV